MGCRGSHIKLQNPMSDSIEWRFFCRNVADAEKVEYFFFRRVKLSAILLLLLPLAPATPLALLALSLWSLCSREVVDEMGNEDFFSKCSFFRRNLSDIIDRSATEVAAQSRSGWVSVRRKSMGELDLVLSLRAAVAADDEAAIVP